MQEPTRQLGAQATAARVEVTEFNVHADPEAAQEVFAARGVPGKEAPSRAGGDLGGTPVGWFPMFSLWRGGKGGVGRGSFSICSTRFRLGVGVPFKSRSTTNKRTLVFPWTPERGLVSDSVIQLALAAGLQAMPTSDLSEAVGHFYRADYAE